MSFSKLFIRAKGLMCQISTPVFSKIKSQLIKESFASQSIFCNFFTSSLFSSSNTIIKNFSLLLLFNKRLFTLFQGISTFLASAQVKVGL
jgi:hypothetical protein